MCASRSPAEGNTVTPRKSPRKRKRNNSVIETTAEQDAARSTKSSTNPQSSKKQLREAAVSKSPGPDSKVEASNSGEIKPSLRTKKSSGKHNLSIGAVEQEIQIAKNKSKKVESKQTEETEETARIKSDVKAESATKVVKKRKTKEERAAEAMPVAARTLGHPMYVGAHMSIAKGVEHSVGRAVYVGGNAFALFLKNQRQWETPPLKAENRDAFRKACINHNFDAMSHVVPHGSYLVNLATPNQDKAKQAYDAFIDDLHRCEALGIKYYNFHPGNTNQEPLDEAIGRISGNLNRALSETSTVVPLLENMAGRGSVIGSRFSDLRDIIAGVKPEFRSRVGICIDTCHAFAAGYDLRSPESYNKTFQELDDVVGLRYLKAMHINDSKAPFDSHKDLHQNIGVGFLGLRAFHNIMNDARLHGIPLVLETPSEDSDPTDPPSKNTQPVWAREIKLLESLTGMDPEGLEFLTLEKELSARGLAERVKMEASIAATEEKKRKKLEKGQKSISDIFGAKGTKGTKGKAKPDTAESESEEDEVSDAQ